MKAIISDIHANKEALEAVLKDIERQGIAREDIICCGDIVGYGGSPLECWEMLEGIEKILGNHEKAMYDIDTYINAFPIATKTWRTHRKIMKDKIEELKELPLRHEEQNGQRMLIYTHSGLIRTKHFEYINAEDYIALRDHGMRIGPKQVVFTGHTHKPIVVNYGRRIDLEEFCGDEQTYKLASRAHVCVGSVGQPRDGDWRACYAIYDGDVTFRRVEYDIKAAADKISQNKEIPWWIRWLLRKRLVNGG